MLDLIKRDAKELTAGNKKIFRKIYFRDQKAIIALTELMKNSQDEETQITAASYVGKIDPGNNQAVDLIIERIKSCGDKEKSEFAIYILGEIGNTNQKALDTLLYLINSSQEKEIHRTVIMSLGEIACTNPKAATILQDLSSSSLDKDILSYGKYILSELNCGRKSFLSFSIPNKPISRSIPTIFSEVYKLQEASNNENQNKFLERIIGKIISSNKVEVVDALVELIINNDYAKILWEAIDALGEVGEGNQTAINTLIELINNSENVNIRWRAVENLGKIDPSNQIIIDTLICLISERHKIFFSSFLLMDIGKFGYGNPKAINALIDLIKNSHNNYDTNAANSLQKIVTNEYMATVITALKEVLLENTETNDVKRYQDCVRVLWHCAQKMSYPDFYKAWH